MSPDHAPRRSQVVLVEPALSQLEKLTAAETHRLDRAIVAISVNPELGTPVSGSRWFSPCRSTSTKGRHSHQAHVRAGSAPDPGDQHIHAFCVGSRAFERCPP